MASITKDAVPLGLVPGGEEIHFKVVLALPHETQALALLRQQLDRASPQYHRWLRPREFMAKFGPTSAMFAATMEWLDGIGLKGARYSTTAISVAASAETIEHAFHLKLERYRTKNGVTGYLPTPLPQVPASLTHAVAGILGLDTLWEPEGAMSGALSPTDSVQTLDGVTPCFGATNATTTNGGWTLDEVGNYYGIGSLLNDGLNGSGQTVGLLEEGAYADDDIYNYVSCFQLPSWNSPDAYQHDQVDSTGEFTGTDGEADVDVEQILTQAPEAHVIAYEGAASYQGTWDAMNAMVNPPTTGPFANVLPQVISDSVGQCEPWSNLATVTTTTGQSGSFISLFDQLLSEAASQNQTVVASAGDLGSEDCSGTNSLAVQYPASSPWVLSVGGTNLYTTSSGTTAENDGNAPCTGCTVGGGGLSQVEAQPNFQSALPPVSGCTISMGCREVPDLSANAVANMTVFDSNTTGDPWTSAAGTSLSAPLVAGLVADRNTGCTTPTGFFDPALYALYQAGFTGGTTNSMYGTNEAFNDIQVGNNDMTGTNGGQYAATQNYDLATGIGSPQAAGLACPEVTSVSPATATPGSQVTVHGLGLEDASILIGGQVATPSTTGPPDSATRATVIVPDFSGQATVAATSVLGSGTQTATLTDGWCSSTGTDDASAAGGYWLAGADGSVYSCGDAPYLGSAYGQTQSSPIVSIASCSTSTTTDYFLAARDGEVFSFANASPQTGGNPSIGSAADPVVGIAALPDCDGYWLVTAQGAIFAYGGAHFYGSLPGRGAAVHDIVGIAATPDGQGYWVVGADMSVYAFGDAQLEPLDGSGSVSQVDGIAPTSDGHGYWVVNVPGVVTSFGDALAAAPTTPIVGIAATTTAGSQGFWSTAPDGSVQADGNATLEQSLEGAGINDIVGIAGYSP